jgi:hypothetical protein
VLLFAGVGPLRMRPVVSIHDLGDLGAKMITSSLSPHQQASSLEEGAQPRSPRTGAPDGESRGAHRRGPCNHASPQLAIGPMPPLLAVAATHGSQCRAGAPIDGHLSSPAQHGTGPCRHGHESARARSARSHFVPCRAGTMGRAQGTARARRPFFVPCRHDGTSPARWAVCAVPAQSTAPH